jgi:hypothetical protein
LVHSNHQMIEDVPDDFLKAIGRVAVNWSRLEMSVDQAIASILRVSPDAHAAMTVGLTFQIRLDMLASLNGTVRDERQKGELTKIIDEIRQRQADRNFIVHAAWIDGGDDVQGHVLKRRPKKDRVEIWTSKDISKVADQINDILGKLVGWLLSSKNATTIQAASIMVEANKRPSAPRRSRKPTKG